jgi:hypothetical protein
MLTKLAKELRRHAVLAWRNFATGERRTAWRLLTRGFLFRREPSFVRGMKPDFLTCGRGCLWVEVKELEQPESQALLGFAWNQLFQRFAPFAGQCRVDGWVSTEFDERVARQVTHLLAQELRAGLPKDQELYLAVPAGDLSNDVISLAWTGRNGNPIRMVAYRSLDGHYGCPAAAGPDDWNAPLQIFGNDVVIEDPAFRVLSEDRPARALLRVDKSQGERVLRGLGGAEAHSVKTVDRIRHVIAHANRQLRNGQKYRAAPGIVVLFNDHLGGGDHFDILRACLGDLTALVNPRAVAPATSFYGRNGVLRATKNTAISAIEYRSRYSATITLMNPHAAYPVERAWLAGTVYYVDAAGNVQSG